MQIVTLTTDWGYGDYYMGVVKGRLYSTIADVQVVDITHNIRKYDNLSAAFVVKNACFEFPEGTIHIIDVNSYEETKDDAPDDGPPRCARYQRDSPKKPDHSHEMPPHHQSGIA